MPKRKTNRIQQRDIVRICDRCGNQYLEKTRNHPFDSVSLIQNGYEEDVKGRWDEASSMELDPRRMLSKTVKNYNLCPNCMNDLLKFMEPQTTPINSWRDDYPVGQRVYCGNPKYDIVIFIDGQGMTYNHHKYDMISEHSVEVVFDKIGRMIMTEYQLTGVTYSETDEISFIITNPETMIKNFDLHVGCYEDYLLSVFLCQWTQISRKEYPDASYQSSLFYIKDSDVSRYLQQRKLSCAHVALAYYAKEYLPKEEYVGLDYPELAALLNRKGLYDSLISNHALYEGIESHYGFNKRYNYDPASDENPDDSMIF